MQRYRMGLVKSVELVGDENGEIILHSDHVKDVERLKTENREMRLALQLIANGDACCKSSSDMAMIATVVLNKSKGESK